jgi:hypothetical protein
VFNELSTSPFDIAVDVNGNPMTVNSTNLGILALDEFELDSNTNIDSLLRGLTVSLQNPSWHRTSVEPVGRAEPPGLHQ